MKINLNKKQQIIRPHEQEAFFRTMDNFEYSFNGGDSRGILPLFRYDEAKTVYKKIYDNKRNWTYSIPLQYVVVNIEEIDVTNLEHVLLDNKRAIISRKDFYKIKRLSLSAQFDMWVVSEYTDRMATYPDFYHVLKRKISNGQGYEFLKNFYIIRRELYPLCNYNISVLKDEKLILEYKKRLELEILSLKIDLKFAKDRFKDLSKKIVDSRKKLQKFSKEDPKLNNKKLESLIRKQEKLIKKSILYGGDSFQKELNSVNQKIEKIGSFLEKSEKIRQELLDKTEELESQYVESLELCSSLKKKIDSLEDKVSDLELDIETVLEEEGNYERY